MRQVDEFLEDVLSEDVYYRFNPEGVNWSVVLDESAQHTLAQLQAHTVRPTSAETLCPARCALRGLQIECCTLTSAGGGDGSFETTLPTSWQCASLRA